MAEQVFQIKTDILVVGGGAAAATAAIAAAATGVAVLVVDDFLPANLAFCKRLNFIRLTFCLSEQV